MPVGRINLLKYITGQAQAGNLLFLLALAMQGYCCVDKGAIVLLSLASSLL